MRITEAIAALAAEYPMYSKSKVKAALKIEMQKTPDVETALVSARTVINNGALAAITRMQHTDATANEVQTRVGKSDMWKVANPHGSMATKGIRPGLTDSDIADAVKSAEDKAEAYHRAGVQS